MRARLLPMIIAILLAAAAAWGVLALAAPPGPGLDPDAMSYLGSAQSLAAGHGLRIPTAAWDRADSTAPLSHFPPGFPLALAAGVRGGLTPINAARLIEALAAAVTAAAVFLALVGAGSLPAGLLAVVALAVTPAMLIVHASVLSEPPYLAITTLVIWQLARAPRAGQRPWVLGALATAGVLTRYAGVALVIAVVLDGWWREGDWRTRLRAAFEAAVIPLIAMAFWLLSRAAQPEGAPVRRSGLYLAGLGATIREGGATVTRWLAPGVESPLLATATAVIAGAVATATAVVAGAVAIALVGRFAFTLRAEQAATADRALLRALALVALSYLVVLVASRLLADGDLPLDERLLAPLMLVLTIGGSLALVRGMREAPRRLAVALAALVGAWGWGAMTVMQEALPEFRDDGGDLAAVSVRSSPQIAYARTHAGPLFSNDPAAVWLHTGRPTRSVPDDRDARAVDAFGVMLERVGGAVIGFDATITSARSPDSLAARAGLLEVLRGPNGGVWRAPTSPPASPPLRPSSRSSPAPAASDPPAGRRAPR